MAHKHEFRIYHAITGDFIRRIKLNDVSYNSPVYGKGGSLTAEAPIAPGQTAKALKETIEHGMDRHAIYVFRNGNLHWGGPLSSHSWHPKERKLAIGAIQWKQWLYNKFLTPDRSVNPVKDKAYAWTGTDQLQIARNLVTEATNDDGCPDIVLGTETSGVPRELTTYGMNFQYCGDRIDSMASRDQGFEWDLQPRVFSSPVQRIQLVFVPHFPERGTYQQGMSLRFKSTQRGGNIELPDNFEVTAEARRTRQWATGAGTPPDQLAAFDEDPELAAGTILNRETITNYGDVSKIDTLAEHARAEREHNGVPISAMTVTASLEDPPVESYESGDRARLIIQDEWMDVDIPAVRILDRQIKLNHSDSPDKVEILLNLNDFELPENTTEVEE